jgi:hypothetical protein
MSKVQKLMKRYVKVVAIQAALQFTIIFIMAGFATGLAFIYKNKVSVLATFFNSIINHNDTKVSSNFRHIY